MDVLSFLLLIYRYTAPIRTPLTCKTQALNEEYYAANDYKYLYIVADEVQEYSYSNEEIAKPNNLC